MYYTTKTFPTYSIYTMLVFPFCWVKLKNLVKKYNFLLSTHCCFSAASNWLVWMNFCSDFHSEKDNQNLRNFVLGWKSIETVYFLIDLFESKTTIRYVNERIEWIFTMFFWEHFRAVPRGRTYISDTLTECIITVV